MTYFFQQFLNGVATGAIYALGACVDLSHHQYC